MSVRFQYGVGMIEALATLFILSVGLLGIAGLQAKGIEAGYSASLRTVAILMSEDIASRMQANRAGVYNGVINQGYYDAGTASSGTDNSCSDSVTKSAVVCTPIKMAEHDIYLWKQNIAKSLPAGATGEVSTQFINSTTDSGSLVKVTVTIKWNEKSTQMSYLDSFEILSPWLN